MARSAVLLSGRSAATYDSGLLHTPLSHRVRTAGALSAVPSRQWVRKSNHHPGPAGAPARPLVGWFWDYARASMSVDNFFCD